MDGFKDSTRMKYMCGGPVKKATGGPVKMFEGGTYNERGKRATMAEIAAEDRRMAASAAAKKPMPKKMPDSATAARLAGAAAGAAAGKMGAAQAAQAAQAAEAALLRRTTGAAMTEGERRAILAAAKKAVPAHSDRPMIRRKAGGLASMPKGKC